MSILDSDNLNRAQFCFEIEVFRSLSMFTAGDGGLYPLKQLNATCHLRDIAEDYLQQPMPTKIKRMLVRHLQIRRTEGAASGRQWYAPGKTLRRVAKLRGKLRELVENKARQNAQIDEMLSLVRQMTE